MIDEESLCAKCSHTTVCSKRQTLETKLCEIHDGTFFSETQAPTTDEEKKAGLGNFVYSLQLKGGFFQCPDYEEVVE